MVTWEWGPGTGNWEHEGRRGPTSVTVLQTNDGRFNWSLWAEEGLVRYGRADTLADARRDGEEAGNAHIHKVATSGGYVPQEALAEVRAEIADAIAILTAHGVEPAPADCTAGQLVGQVELAAQMLASGRAEVDRLRDLLRRIGHDAGCRPSEGVHTDACRERQEA